MELLLPSTACAPWDGHPNRDDLAKIYIECFQNVFCITSELMQQDICEKVILETNCAEVPLCVLYLSQD
jgi:hypothetical protein